MKECGVLTRNKQKASAFPLQAAKREDKEIEEKEEEPGTYG